MTTQSSDQVQAFREALLSLNRVAALALMERDVSAHAPHQLAEQLIVPALEQIGADWEKGSVALSQVYMSGRICEELVNLLLPARGTDVAAQPRMAIAVLEDHHLLGKRLVYSVLRASGYAVADYGRVDVESLALATLANQVDILFVSTLMLRSALRVPDLKTRLRALGSGARIVVGGAPFRFDRNLWKEVGADAGGVAASDALGIVDRMTRQAVSDRIV